MAKGWCSKVPGQFSYKAKIQGKISLDLLSNRRGKESAEANLAKDALAGQEFGGQANHETHHGQAAIPSFSKSDEAEAGFRSSHWWRLRSVN